MAQSNELTTLLESLNVAPTFTPYVEYSEQADAINVYFRGDPDYSKRLTDHVTLYLSLKDHRLVGCRIKGIAGIIEDLPNYLNIDHDGIKLSLVFWSFRGSIDDKNVQGVMRELAKEAGDLVLSP